MMKRSPFQPSEFDIHVSVADLLRRFARKDWVWTHFPAGEKRSEETGARLKRMGLQPGWPDFILIDVRGRLHLLELKSEKGLVQTAQQWFQACMQARGVEYAMARSFEDAIAILARWGVVPVTVPGRGKAAA